MKGLEIRTYIVSYRIAGTRARYTEDSQVFVDEDGGNLTKAMKFFKSILEKPNVSWAVLSKIVVSSEPHYYGLTTKD